MKVDFQETIKQKTGKELETISKDCVFYSEEERYIALTELESRNSLTKELHILKYDMETGKKMEEDAKKPPHKIRFKDLFPHENYVYTPLLIYVNLLVFTLMALFGVNIFQPKIDSLIQWGGNIRYLTINGQLWRLVSSVFLHAGILHLVFNMYALLYAGSVLEKVIGRGKFIFAYFISGIFASVSSLMMNETVVSVGASGAIFGLFGVLLPLLASDKKDNFPNISIEKMLLNCFLFVSYCIVYGFGKSGIDNAAHIGGLFGGVITGLFYSSIIKKKMQSTTVYIILTVLSVSFSALVITNVSDKIGEYNRVMKEFGLNEKKALWMYHENFDNLSESKRIYFKDKLTTEGIDIWKKNIALLEEIKNNDYDGIHVRKIEILIDYAVLREKSCELMIQLLENKSSEIEQKLLETNRDIENKIKELKNNTRP